MLAKGLHISFRTFIVLVIVLMLALLYLHSVGIPSFATERWITAQEEQGRYLDSGHITFNVFSGLVAHDFKYYQTRRRVTPMLKAEAVELDFELVDWVRKRPAWNGMTIYNGTLRYSASGLLMAADPNQVITIENLNSTVTWEDEEMRVRDLRASILGIELEGEGEIDLAVPGEEKPAPLGLSNPAWVPQLVEQLNSVTFESPPRLRVTFLIFPYHVQRSEVELTGKGGSTSVRGIEFDGWSIVGNLKDEILDIQKVEVFSESRRLRLESRFDTSTRQIGATMDCNLPPVQWLSLMPIAWRDRLDEMGFFFSGPVHCVASVGPAPIQSVWKEFSGRVDAEEADFHGVWFDRLSMQFDCTPDAVELSSLEARLGRDGEWGHASGEMTWTFPDHRFAGALQSHLDFAAVIPLVSPNFVNLIQSFKLSDKPAAGDLTFEGQKGNQEAFRLQGDVTGTNFAYRGAHIKEGSTGLTISNRVVTLDPLRLERDEGRVDGSLLLDLANRRIEIDLAGNVEARPVGLAAGPTVERILGTFDFGAPVQTSVKGPIDLNQPENTHLHIQAETHRFGLRSYVAERVKADILWTNRTVDVRSFDAEIYGGEVSGSYRLLMKGKEEPAAYELSAQVENVNFEEVVRTLAHKEGEPYSGHIFGSVKMGGLMGKGNGQHAKGTGSIRIEDGRVMSIPLFGGLSRGLSKIYPGLGFTKQTDFESDFQIEDLMLKSDNVTLEGDVFSVTAKGRYGVVDRSLHFSVEFKLLREGGVGKVVRLVTLPLSKLLQFDLRGTLDEPKWRPNNLPKELFLDFE